ncbi:MAG: PAS domain-containing sensor histidine kinase [Rhodospirillum sp.]|nr:PAS domain-containing sensor histidine kinase [Rhodospirillum sp.]
MRPGSESIVSGRTIKRAALIFLPLAVAAVVASYLLYASQANAIRSTAQATEGRVVDIARQRVGLTVSSLMADVSYLSEQDALRTYLAGSDPAALRHLEAEYLAFARHRQFFDQLRFIDASGQEIVRVNRKGDAVALAPPDQLQNKADQDYTIETMKLDRGQTFVSDIDLNVEQGTIEQPAKPTIRVGEPVFDDSGTKRGIVVINYLAQRILDRVSELRDPVADIWLVNAQGYWLLGPPEDAFAFMYPERKDRTFAAAHPDAWRQMQSVPAGRVETEFGRFAYARAEVEQSGGNVGPILSSWFVVIPTPHAFSDAQTSVLRFNFAVASGGLLLVLAGISLGLARHQVHRLEAEQLVRLSEARLRAVTETASDAIISADREGIVRYFNPGAEKAFGHAEQDIVGHPLTELMPERFRQLHTGGFRHYLETRDPKVVGQTVELVGLRKDGREFPIELALASSEVDGALFFTAIVRDITKRAEAECEIQDLNRRLQLDNAELEAVNKELEAFSYSVSHDLRAPLRAIDGFSQALVEDAGPLLKSEHHSHLNRVRQAAQRMGVLIDDLIKLARVTRTDVKIADVDLSEIALALATSLQDSAPQRQVEFAIAPDVQATGDPRLMQVALDNLLNNSWKFTASRSPARIEFGKTVANGKPAFFVRDNGVGFDMNYAGKMFGAFQRFHDAREFAGTGIGLATVQRIVHKHGGRIWAESQPGEGATFYFTL